MASFFDEIAANQLRTFVLMAIFIAFFGLVIYTAVLLFFYGSSSGVIYTLFVFCMVFVIIYAVFTYFAGDKIILAVSNAKEADRKQYPNFYSSVEGLSSAMQVKMPRVYVINDPSPNAFAAGRKGAPSVTATTGLLSMMSRDELDGVIAHEMSHVADNDVLLMTVAIAFAGVIGLVAAFARNMIFWGGLGGRRNEGYIVLIAFAIGLLAPLFAFLIRLAISRRREYIADANGARVTRNPAALASALTKIKNYMARPTGQQVMHANEITASLYFTSPFKTSSIMNLFSTHPPIEERIKRLQAMY